MLFDFEKIKPIGEFLAWIVGIWVSLKSIYEIFKLIKKYYIAKNEREEKLNSIINNFDNLKVETENLAQIGKDLKSKNKAIYDMLEQIEINQNIQSEVQKIIINQNGVYWKSDSEGKTIEMSKSVIQLTGRTYSELEGFNWFNYVVDEDKDRVEKDMQTAIKNESNFLTHYRMIKADGSLIHIRAEAFAIRHKHKIICWIGVLSELHNVS
jgi:PAS domain S-box-containing protein